MQFLNCVHMLLQLIRLAVLGLAAFGATQLPLYLTGSDVPVGQPVRTTAPSKSLAS